MGLHTAGIFKDSKNTRKNIFVYWKYYVSLHMGN